MLTGTYGQSARQAKTQTNQTITQTDTKVYLGAVSDPVISKKHEIWMHDSPLLQSQSAKPYQNCPLNKSQKPNVTVAIQ